MRTFVRAGLSLRCTPLGVYKAWVYPVLFESIVTVDEKWRLELHRGGQRA